MPEEMRVKYLFINLAYSAYIKLCVGILLFILVGSLSSFLAFQNSPSWTLRNCWWMMLIFAAAGLGEMLMAIAKAKKDHARNQT